MNRKENFDTRLKSAINKSLYKKTGYKIAGDVSYSSVFTRIYNVKKPGETAAMKVILVEKQREHSVYQNQDLSESEKRCNPKDSYDHELHALQSLKNNDAQYVVDILSSGNVVDFEDWEVYYFLMKKYTPLIDTRSANKQAIYDPLMTKWIQTYGRNDVAAYLGYCISNAFLEMREAHIENNRDIKPENIFLANGEENLFLNRFILGDFGESHPESSVITTAQAHIGTKEYIPGNEEANTSWKYDQFMLGVTMYEIFNGVPIPPYETRSTDENGRYREWVSGVASIPVPAKYEVDPALFRIISKMTMYNADERYDRIEDLIDDLFHAIGNFAAKDLLNSTDKPKKNISFADKPANEKIYIIFNTVFISICSLFVAKITGSAIDNMFINHGFRFSIISIIWIVFFSVCMLISCFSGIKRMEKNLFIRKKESLIYTLLSVFHCLSVLSVTVFSMIALHANIRFFRNILFLAALILALNQLFVLASSVRQGKLKYFFTFAFLLITVVFIALTVLCCIKESYSIQRALQIFAFELSNTVSFEPILI